MPDFKHTPEQARKLWVEALRSGEFSQCRQVMRDGDGGHCCLDVARIACERSEGLSFPLNSNGCSDLNLRNFPDVQVWLGLESPTGSFGEVVESLEKENDRGLSFAAIADLIESAPPGLFAEDSR